MRHFFREWQEASHATPGRRRYHNITIWVVLAIGVWNLAVPVWVCPVAVIADWVLYAFLVRKWIRGDLLSAYRAEHPAGPAEEDAPLAMASASAMISSPEDLLWLLDRSENKGYLTGVDASGWEDSTWILNAFYELPIHGEVPSHDELRKSRIASGEEEPLIINGFNLGLATTNSGGGLGYHARPRPLTGSDVPGQRYWTASLSRSRQTGRLRASGGSLSEASRPTSSLQGKDRWERKTSLNSSEYSMSIRRGRCVRCTSRTSSLPPLTP